MMTTTSAVLQENPTQYKDGAETPWPALIERIQANEAEGMEDLYRVFCNGIRFYLYRQLGRQDLEDTLHDSFLTVTQAIRRGDLREPERLMGFVWTVVRRQLAGKIEQTVNQRNQRTEVDGAVRVFDRNPDPERTAIGKEHQMIAYRLLNEVSGRDREILVRFYLQEQTQSEICREMQLTDTQFRLLKSRAKARFGALGRKRLARRGAMKADGKRKSEPRSLPTLAGTQKPGATRSAVTARGLNIS
jgi:RNA polymerase sigma factor (sigma-70 family)